MARSLKAWNGEDGHPNDPRSETTKKLDKMKEAYNAAHPPRKEMAFGWKLAILIGVVILIDLCILAYRCANPLPDPSQVIREEVPKDGQGRQNEA